MSSLVDYFEKRNLYKPTYFIGDRVFGKYKKIPFIGSVAIDGLVSLGEGPRLIVFTDLPIVIDGKIYRQLQVKHKDVKPLKKF